MSTWELEVSTDAAAQGRARRQLRAWLADLSCSEESTEDAVLVMAELVANASSGGASRARVAVSFDSARLRIECCDDVRRPGNSTGLEDDLARAIVSAATDGWGWRDHGAGTCVWTEMLC